MSNFFRELFGKCISGNVEMDPVGLDQNIRTDAAKTAKCNKSNYDLDPESEIPEKNLKILEDGNFGTLCGFIFKNSCLPGGQEMRVKIKKPQKNRNEKMIIDEIRTMYQVGPHPNILTLIGYTMSKKTPVLIVEYAQNGSLLDYLRSHRETFVNQLTQEYLGEYGKVKPIEEDSKSLCTFDLLSFAYQLANGMKYLASREYVHGKLYCRNIFVSWDKTIRIGEFTEPQQFKNDNSQFLDRDMHPVIEWLAPEVIAGFGYSEKSDIWAFGFCLLEIFSLGRESYKGINNRMEYLPDRGSFEKPDYCPHEIYRNMMFFWKEDPNHRPSFSEFEEFLKEQCDELNFKIIEDLNNKLELVAMHQRNLRNMIFP